MVPDLRGGSFFFWAPFAFLGFFYAAIVSRFLPASEDHVAAFIRSDRYYCFLVPLTLPVLVVAVYFHWLSMKFFQHA